MHKSEGQVIGKVERQVGYLTFSHPAHNSLPAALLQSISDQILEWGKDTEVKAIVLQSGGERTFCAGANFQELCAIKDIHSGKEFFMGFANVINAIRCCTKLVVGRIQGKAVGGGVGLAAACDYTIATEKASIKLSEISLGIGPFVIEPALLRKIGLAAFSTLSLNPSQWQTASWAHQVGLYQQIVESVDELDQHLESFVQNWRSYDLAALLEMKTVLWEGTEQWDTLLMQRAEKSGQLVLSPFTQERLLSLINKK